MSMLLVEVWRHVKRVGWVPTLEMVLSVNHVPWVPSPVLARVNVLDVSQGQVVISWAVFVCLVLEAHSPMVMVCVSVVRMERFPWAVLLYVLYVLVELNPILRLMDVWLVVRAHSRMDLVVLLVLPINTPSLVRVDALLVLQVLKSIPREMDVTSVCQEHIQERMRNVPLVLRDPFQPLRGL